VLLRPLVWTVRFLEIPVGKHLEQLRGDRLVEHILAAADQRFVEVDMRGRQMVDGPASREPRRPAFHKISSRRPMSRNERRASLFRHMNRRKQLIQAVEEAERELDAQRRRPEAAASQGRTEAA
jgi:hypothetical protein